MKLYSEEDGNPQDARPASLSIRMLGPRRRVFSKRMCFFTPRVSDGCNSFGIVCVCVCDSVCLSRSHRRTDRHTDLNFGMSVKWKDI